MKVYIARTACQRYKATNLKPAELLQTPVLRQRFEVPSMDPFGPLPEAPTGERWILIIEDYATRWTELFALRQATAEACAWHLIHDVILRYGLPRLLISGNGTQFISGIMQQVTYCLNIEHRFTPVYHPSANPVERKNRDLKTQLAIQIGDQHDQWPHKLPSIRFAMNSTPCQSTGFSAAYVNLGRELRTPTDVFHDLRRITLNENLNPKSRRTSYTSLSPYSKPGIYMKRSKIVRSNMSTPRDAPPMRINLEIEYGLHFILPAKDPKN